MDKADFAIRMPAAVARNGDKAVSAVAHDAIGYGAVAYGRRAIHAAGGMINISDGRERKRSVPRFR
jgi:hypothetical protein